MGNYVLSAAVVVLAIAVAALVVLLTTGEWIVNESGAGLRDAAIFNLDAQLHEGVIVVPVPADAAGEETQVGAYRVVLHDRSLLGDSYHGGQVYLSHLVDGLVGVAGIMHRDDPEAAVELLNILAVHYSEHEVRPRMDVSMTVAELADGVARGSEEHLDALSGQAWFFDHRHALTEKSSMPERRSEEGWRAATSPSGESLPTPRTDKE